MFGYRLNAVDLQQRVIWHAECLEPAGQGLAFGGQDQEADDGQPHTRILADRRWQAIHHQLRDNHALQPLHTKVWQARNEAKDILARCRLVFFRGRPAAEETALLETEVFPRLLKLRGTQLDLASELRRLNLDAYENAQAEQATERLLGARRQVPDIGTSIDADDLKALHKAQIELELAAEFAGCRAVAASHALRYPTYRRQPAADGRSGNRLRPPIEVLRFFNHRCIWQFER